MKRIAPLSILLTLLVLAMWHQPVEAGPDPDATPEPSAKPTSLNDPNYQILNSIEGPNGAYQIHLVTEATTDPESIYCGGWTSSCFIFVNETMIESVQFISITNGQEESEFRGRTLSIQSLESLNETTIMFSTVFADANHSSSAQYCLQVFSDTVDLLQTWEGNYNPETETLDQEVDVFLDAFCAPIVFPHKTFITFVGGPF